MKLIVKNNIIEIKVCNNFSKKLIGLMFKKNIKYGLCFNNCNAIHTFFMKEKIDVIMTDKNNKVIYIYNNLPKNRIIMPKKNAYYTYEIPNSLNSYNVGDILNLIK